MNPTATEPQPEPAVSPVSGGAGRPLAVGALVTALAALLSYLAPSVYAATAVAFCFFVASYLLVLRGSAKDIRHHGIALGGILEPVPLNPARILRELGTALAWALLACGVLFPPFWGGFVEWWRPHQEFQFPEAPSPDEIVGQLLVIALPEELFYRGYLQTALDDAFAKRGRVRVLGVQVGPALLLSSLIFALGHLATEMHPGRLAVFFPSLVFGWLRARSRGVGAAIAFHAACNLFSAYLARGYGFMH